MQSIILIEFTFKVIVWLFVIRLLFHAKFKYAGHKQSVPAYVDFRELDIPLYLRQLLFYTLVILWALGSA